MAEHNKLGIEGESQAENYLKTKGYTILERNWHSGHNELDLIATFQGWLIIVEVKTRTGNRWQRPEEAITPLKIRRIVRAAHHYICRHRLDKPVRFDVISVVFENTGWKIEHFEDAFLPPFQ